MNRALDALIVTALVAFGFVVSFAVVPRRSRPSVSHPCVATWWDPDTARAGQSIALELAAGCHLTTLYDSATKTRSIFLLPDSLRVQTWPDDSAQRHRAKGRSS